MRLTAENIAAKRGEDLLFADISFVLASGEALVLTGRNGTGKSTLLRVLAGLLRPEKGNISWFSQDAEAGARACEACHYLGHRNAMKAELTVAENLSFWKSFFSDFLGGTGSSVSDAAEAVGLQEIIHLPFGYLSAGQQRRMAFAKLLVSHRPVWLLDEPTAALDSGAEVIITGLIGNHLAHGGIVIAATHQPLGLTNARELRMTGFAGVGEGVW